MEVSRVYIYKLTVDDGGAPCIQGGTLSFAICKPALDCGWPPCLQGGTVSLAICKPAIRATARPDNIILGFAANSLYVNNCLVYAENGTRHLDARGYFLKSGSARG